MALRGAVALGLGNLDDASRWLDDSLRRQPTPEAAMNLSIAMQARGDHGAALEAGCSRRGWRRSN